MEYWKNDATYPHEGLFPGANTFPDSGSWIANNSQKEGSYQYGITND